MARAADAGATTAAAVRPTTGRRDAAGSLRLTTRAAHRPDTAAAAGGGLNFANSDMAFRRADMFLGNFNGFNTYDIETPKKPRLLASVVCPGGQGDMSVHGNLLFMSVEQTRGRVDCGTQGVTDDGRAPSGSAASASSTSATSASRSRSPPSRPAAARTRTRW